MGRLHWGIRLPTPCGRFELTKASALNTCPTRSPSTEYSDGLPVKLRLKPPSEADGGLGLRFPGSRALFSGPALARGASTSSRAGLAKLASFVTISALEDV